MKRYLRPVGILSGSAAGLAIAQGQALPLAGGPLAFTLVEIIERDAAGHIARRIVPACPLKDELAPHIRPRTAFAGPPQVMGIVNVTPDSFSDGGAFCDPAAAIAHAASLIAAGARLIDIGGESTRPGATQVDPDEEIRRVVPVIAGIRAIAQASGAVISIDTRNEVTMRAARDAGADLINDVSALTHDPAALPFVAASGLPVVLMHMQGEPARMQQAPAYGDVALDIYDYLDDRIAIAEAAGLGRSRIVIDPGIGFGKTAPQNLALLDSLTLFHGLGAPILIGVSRKGFIGHLSDRAPPSQRLGGSLAAGLAALTQGAQILRVHDVPETVQAVRIAAALWNSGPC